MFFLQRSGSFFMLVLYLFSFFFNVRRYVNLTNTFFSQVQGKRGRSWKAVPRSPSVPVRSRYLLDRICDQIQWRLPLAVSSSETNVVSVLFAGHCFGPYSWFSLGMFCSEIPLWLFGEKKTQDWITQCHIRSKWDSKSTIFTCSQCLL